MIPTSPVFIDMADLAIAVGWRFVGMQGHCVLVSPDDPRQGISVEQQSGVQWQIGPATFHRSDLPRGRRWDVVSVPLLRYVHADDVVDAVVNSFFPDLDFDLGDPNIQAIKEAFDPLYGFRVGAMVVMLDFVYIRTPYGMDTIAQDGKVVLQGRGARDVADKVAPYIEVGDPPPPWSGLDGIRAEVAADLQSDRDATRDLPRHDIRRKVVRQEYAQTFQDNTITVFCDDGHEMFREDIKRAGLERWGCPICARQHPLYDRLAQPERDGGMLYGLPDNSKIEVEVRCDGAMQGKPLHPEQRYPQQLRTLRKGGNPCPMCGRSGSRNTLRYLLDDDRRDRVVHDFDLDLRPSTKQRIDLECPHHGPYRQFVYALHDGKQGCEECVEQYSSQVERDLLAELSTTHQPADTFNLPVPWGKAKFAQCDMVFGSTVIEYDGDKWHREPHRVANDIAKTTALLSANWRVIRVREHPPPCRHWTSTTRTTVRSPMCGVPTWANWPTRFDPCWASPTRGTPQGRRPDWVHR